MSSAGPEPGSRTWRDAALVYTGPRVTGMVWLGFSAGLPYLLVFSTLSAWLRDVGTDLSVIGFFSLVGVTYSVKVIWAPVVDRLPFPLLTRLLGKRRGWMLAAQLGIATGLLCMSQLDPRTSIAAVALCAVLVAFSSATQDITIDAWRIEAADTDLQGAMAAAYVEFALANRAKFQLMFRVDVVDGTSPRLAGALEACHARIYGAMTASGWQTTSVWLRMLIDERTREADMMRFRGERPARYGPSPGFEKLKWIKPVYVGDSVRYTTRVIEKRDSKSKPEVGLLYFQNEGFNQHGELVFSLVSKMFVERRVRSA